MTSIKAMSFGGGVQSTAMLVLAITRQIDVDTAIFANVGDDSEHPDTLDYVNRITKPYAAAHGFDFVEVHKVRRDTGERETILDRINRRNRGVPIPVRMSNGAPGNRQCTEDFKIRVVAKELKARGATPANPARLSLGISIDEYTRMRTSRIKYQVNHYPLIDLQLTRDDCVAIIAEAGLPPAPKSACFFCPFQKKASWIHMAAHRPELFERSIAIERTINETRDQIGKDHVYLSTAGRPLDQAFGASDPQLPLFADDDATCDVGGYCMV